MSDVMAEFKDQAAFEARMEQIAHSGASKALAELFEIFGVDVTTQEGRRALHDDLSWVRETRTGTRILRNTAIGTIVVSVASGLAIALWKGVAALIAAAAK